MRVYFNITCDFFSVASLLWDNKNGKGIKEHRDGYVDIRGRL